MMCNLKVIFFLMSSVECKTFEGFEFKLGRFVTKTKKTHISFVSKLGVVWLFIF